MDVSRDGDVVDPITDAARAVLVAIAARTEFGKALGGSESVRDIAVEKDRIAMAKEPRVPFEVRQLQCKLREPFHESRVVIVIAEDELELARRLPPDKICEPVAGLIGERFSAGLMRPFVVECIAGQDEKISFRSSILNCRQVFVGARSPAEQMQVRDEAQLAGVLLRRRRENHGLCSIASIPTHGNRCIRS